MKLPLSYAINSLLLRRRHMHPKAAPLLSSQIALGWLFLIGRTTAAFCLSPQPQPPLAKKHISSAAFISNSPTHQRHSSAAYFKSFNQMSTARSSSNSNVAEAAAMVLPATKWADVVSTHQNNPNYSPKYLFPPLSSTSHKGSHGRIAILGGSDKYTGAPNEVSSNHPYLPGKA